MPNSADGTRLVGSRGASTFGHALEHGRQELWVLAEQLIDVELHPAEVIQVGFHHADIEAGQGAASKGSSRQHLQPAVRRRGWQSQMLHQCIHTACSLVFRHCRAQTKLRRESATCEV